MSSRITYKQCYNNLICNDNDADINNRCSANKKKCVESIMTYFKVSRTNRWHSVSLIWYAYINIDKFNQSYIQDEQYRNLIELSMFSIYIANVFFFISVPWGL